MAVRRASGSAGLGAIVRPIPSAPVPAGTAARQSGLAPPENMPGTGAVVAQALLSSISPAALSSMLALRMLSRAKVRMLLTQVAPGFQVPVVAVVEQALGREFALY